MKYIESGVKTIKYKIHLLKIRYSSPNYKRNNTS